MVDLKFVKLDDLWYFIGLLAADGCLSGDGRHIEVTSKSKNHLLSVKKTLGLKIKLGNKSRKKSGVKVYYRLQFSDVKLYKYLVTLGLAPKKSLTLGKIKTDQKYFSHFLRGVIDGDGCISTWIHASNLHRQWSLRITSAAPVFIKWLKEEIEKHFCVKGKLYGYKYTGKKNNIYILKFGKLPTKVIIKSVYGKKKSCCLDRKNKKHFKCLQDKDRMINYGNVLGPGVEIGRQSRLKI